MGARRIICRLVGSLQCGLGGLAGVFAYLIFATPSMQEWLSVAPREVPLYMFGFAVLAVLLILSGLLLARGEVGGN